MTKTLTGKKLCVLFLAFLLAVQAGAVFAETRYYPINEIKLTTSDKKTVKVTVTLAYDSADENSG